MRSDPECLCVGIIDRWSLLSSLSIVLLAALKVVVASDISLCITSPTRVARRGTRGIDCLCLLSETLVEPTPLSQLQVDVSKLAADDSSSLFAVTTPDCSSHCSSKLAGECYPRTSLDTVNALRLDPRLDYPPTPSSSNATTYLRYLAPHARPSFGTLRLASCIVLASLPVTTPWLSAVPPKPFES